MSLGNAIRVAAKVQPATSAIIVFHGLGDTGAGWEFLADHLRADKAFQSTNFVFPNAPMMSITANAGTAMPAWFDIKEWEPYISDFDTEGYMKSLGVVSDYIKEQIDGGIPATNIVVGGFSQGAALALGSMLDLRWKIGGFFSLSGFLSNDLKRIIWENEETQRLKSINIETPVFQAHGDIDPMVALRKAESTRDFMVKDCGFKNLEFHVYRDMVHTTVPQEIDDLIGFIKRCWGYDSDS